MFSSTAASGACLGRFCPAHHLFPREHHRCKYSSNAVVVMFVMMPSFFPKAWDCNLRWSIEWGRKVKGQLITQLVKTLFRLLILTCPTSAFLWLWLTFLIHIRKTIVIEIWCQNIDFFLKIFMEFGRNCHYFRCHLITNYLLLILWCAIMICYLRYCCHFSAGKSILKMSIAISVACDHHNWILVVKQRFSNRLYLIWLLLAGGSNSFDCSSLDWIE